MAQQTMLERLKIDLGILNSTRYDDRLTSLLQSAQNEIEREGVVLDTTNIDDSELIIDYARFIWLSRRGDNPDRSMYRSIRYRINNRLFGSERKSRAEGDT